LPIAETYNAAFATMGKRWRDLLEGHAIDDDNGN
jgi:hypothetical protein